MNREIKFRGKRLGDALNSTLKGSSIELRKPIELYY